MLPGLAVKDRHESVVGMLTGRSCFLVMRLGTRKIDMVLEVVSSLVCVSLFGMVGWAVGWVGVEHDRSTYRVRRVESLGIL